MKFITARLRLEALRNASHVELNRLFIELVERAGADKLGITALYEPYKALVLEEERVLDMITSSRLTVDIAGMDKARDRVYRGFADITRACLNHFDETKRDAARQLHDILRHYGNVNRRSLSGQIATLDDVLREMAVPERTALVALLGLDEWLARLGEINRGLERAMTKRFAEWSRKRPERNMQEVRVEVDRAFRAILDRVEMLARLDSPLHDPAFIREVNALVAYFKDSLARGAGMRHHVKDIAAGGHLLVEQIGTLPYTGHAVTPIPRVTYREEGQPDVELVFARDFTVSYRNNTRPGTATLVIRGTGDYTGRRSVTFNIEGDVNYEL
jgi:hypothetical protein